MMFWRTYAVLIFSILLSISLLSAQKQEYLFDTKIFTKEDGLPSLLNTSVFQDSRGFIWIGTGSGLSRFDGYNFQLFSPEAYGMTGKKAISRISEDHKGNLWLFYCRGFLPSPSNWDLIAIDIFDPKAEKVIPFDTYFQETFPFAIEDAFLPQITDDLHRNWIATKKGELFLYNQGFKKIFEKKGASFQYLTIDEHHHIWLVADNTQLIKIDTLGNILESIQTPKHIHGIWTGEGDRLWVALVNNPNTGESSIGLWEKKQDQFVPFYLKGKNHIISGLPLVETLNIYSFCHRSKKGYWYIGLNQQIHLFGPDGEWMYNFQEVVGDDLNVNTYGYYENKDNVWFCGDIMLMKTFLTENHFNLIHQQEEGVSDSGGLWKIPEEIFILSINSSFSTILYIRQMSE
ncbi:MAG: two-component regulator propeller domain-containing protein [Bacteroidia bacterium]